MRARCRSESLLHGSFEASGSLRYSRGRYLPTAELGEPRHADLGNAAYRASGSL
jgi:hypothetical protein